MNRALTLSLLALVAVFAAGCEKAPESTPLSRVSVTDLHKQKVDADAARAVEEAAADKALEVKCVDNIAELMKSARASMKKDEPGDAYKELFKCRHKLASKESKDLLAAADKAMDVKQAKVRLQAEKAAKIAKKKEGVRLGMSPEDVYASMWGKPQTVNRTVTKYGVREQWVYGGGGYLYFQDGVLESVQN